MGYVHIMDQHGTKEANMSGKTLISGSGWTDLAKHFVQEIPQLVIDHRIDLSD